jgi:stearoyl-CoA desaturase (delta-9 desaturase)
MSGPALAPTAPARAALNPLTLLHHSLNLLPMALVHVGVIALFWTGSHWYEWALLPAVIYFRGIFQSVGYHRYFSHRSFKTTRPVQFLMGFFCCANLQQGPLWWAVYHRHHHKHSDHEGDPHSPFHGGFWWAYCGWLFVPLAPDWRAVNDLRRYPELVWLERFWQLPGMLVAALFWCIGGWSMVCVDFCLSAVIVFHLTFVVNTFGHMIGSRRYDTPDGSRNSFLLACLTQGDGWHNNHHKHQHAAQAGIKWYEVDGAFRLIVLMEKLGLVWNVRRVREEDEKPVKLAA